MATANMIVSNMNNQLRSSLKWCSVKAYLFRNQSCLPGMGQIRGYPAGLPGSGVGKGGGGGGSVRESGGGLGEYGAAQEEGYFHRMQKEQLKKIKKKLDQAESPEIQQKKEDK